MLEVSTAQGGWSGTQASTDFLKGFPDLHLLPSKIISAAAYSSLSILLQVSALCNPLLFLHSASPP